MAKNVSTGVKAIREMVLDLVAARAEILRGEPGGMPPDAQELERQLDELVDQAAWISGYITARDMGSTHESAVKHASKKEEKVSRANRG